MEYLIAVMLAAQLGQPALPCEAEQGARVRTYFSRLESDFGRAYPQLHDAVAEVRGACLELAHYDCSTDDDEACYPVVVLGQGGVSLADCAAGADHEDCSDWEDFVREQ